MVFLFTPWKWKWKSQLIQIKPHQMKWVLESLHFTRPLSFMHTLQWLSQIVHKETKVLNRKHNPFAHTKENGTQRTTVGW